MPKKIAIARPRALIGKAWRTIASAAGNMIAAPAPWMTRKTISQASAPEPVGVAPQRAEAVEKQIVGMNTLRRAAAMYASTASDAYSPPAPLLSEWWTSPWIVGSEMATIVWSMKVIDTAKIIAARIS